MQVYEYRIQYKFIINVSRLKLQIWSETVILELIKIGYRTVVKKLRAIFWREIYKTITLHPTVDQASSN